MIEGAFSVANLEELPSRSRGILGQKKLTILAFNIFGQSVEYRLTLLGRKRGTVQRPGHPGESDRSRFGRKRREHEERWLKCGFESKRSLTIYSNPHERHSRVAGKILLARFFLRALAE